MVRSILRRSEGEQAPDPGYAGRDEIGDHAEGRSSGEIVRRNRGAAVEEIEYLKVCFDAIPVMDGEELRSFDIPGADDWTSILPAWSHPHSGRSLLELVGGEGD